MKMIIGGFRDGGQKFEQSKYVSSILVAQKRKDRECKRIWRGKGL